jgi:hypothetical protein
MGKTISILVLLAMAVIGSLGLMACGDQPGVVEGTVTQASGGEPMAQTQVVIYGTKKAEEVTGLDVYQKGPLLQKQLTDENGRFSFSLEPGSYIIQVWIQGLEVADRMVKVKAGRTTTTDFAVAVP